MNIQRRHAETVADKRCGTLHPRRIRRDDEIRLLRADDSFHRVQRQEALPTLGVDLLPGLGLAHALDQIPHRRAEVDDRFFAGQP